ncbi:IS3 family transposase [Companilactobacillus versmoldensis]|uniref:HTH-like domain-containing protein n=1 Tax=Companilactobacillus versmoldensis DSM 14857 = KCTC 3814 TaxID=1423815 RepID=A0A0R1SE21_9LACO|nr:IS3 family transposase [Companilactobacillus versmoldensis]KRL67597.1 hypothetical protein FC27_GL001621 [Companilactobacillus versmoldensis DSM 14857 = KCTC 3814]
MDEIRQSDPKYTKKYGYRRMTDALKELSFTVNHKKVLRIMTDGPYQKLVADVNEFRYGDIGQNDRVYLEPIMDLFSGEILAFNISEHPTVEFAIKPLKEALNMHYKVKLSDNGTYRPRIPISKWYLAKSFKRTSRLSEHVQKNNMS